MPPKTKRTPHRFQKKPDYKTLFKNDTIPVPEETTILPSGEPVVFIDVYKNFFSKPGLLKEAVAYFVNDTISKYTTTTTTTNPTTFKPAFLVLKVDFFLFLSDPKINIQKEREEEFECLTGIPAELYKYNWLLTDDEWIFRRFVSAITTFAGMKIYQVDEEKGYILFAKKINFEPLISSEIERKCPSVDLFPGGLKSPFYGDVSFSPLPLDEEAGGDSDVEDSPGAFLKPPRSSPSPLSSSDRRKTPLSENEKIRLHERYERDRAIDAPDLSQRDLNALRKISREKKKETDKIKKAFSADKILTEDDANPFKYNQNALSFAISQRRKFVLSNFPKTVVVSSAPKTLLNISFESLRKIRDTSIFSDIPREVSGIITLSENQKNLEAHSECMFFGTSDAANPSLYYFDFHTHPLKTALENANSSTAFPSGDDIYSSFSNYEKGSIASIVLAPEGVYAHWLTPEAQEALVNFGISERSPSSEGLAFNRLIEGAILGVSSEVMTDDETEDAFKLLFKEANLDSPGGNIYAEAVSEQFGLSICESKERKECLESEESRGFLWCAYKHSPEQVRAAKEWAARLGVSFTVRRLLEFLFDRRVAKRTEWFVESFGEKTSSQNPNTPLFGASFQSWSEIKSQGAFTGIPPNLLERWIPPYDRFMNIDLSILKRFKSSGSAASSSSPTLTIPTDYKKFGNSEDEDDPFAVSFFNKRMVSTKWPTACVWLGAYRQFNPDAFVSPINPFPFYTHEPVFDVTNPLHLEENKKRIQDLDSIKTSVFNFFRRSEEKDDEKTQIDINTLRKTGKCPSKPYKISAKDAKILLKGEGAAAAVTASSSSKRSVVRKSR